MILIKKARIRKNVSVIPLNKQNTRFAAPGSNHHMEIIAILNNKGEEIEWEGHIVSLFEAYRRHKAKPPEPVIRDKRHDWGPNKKFKFSLADGEYLMMEVESGKDSLVRTVVVSERSLEFRLHNDARPITVLKKISKARITSSPSALFKRKARKVVVDPLGNIIPAND